MRVGIALAIALIIGAQQGSAQFGLATEYTQILNKLELIAGQATRLRMYADMLRNSQALPQMPWDSIENDLRNAQRALSFGQAIAASMANAHARYRALYPGYGRNTRPYHLSYAQWSATALDTMAGFVRAAEEHERQMAQEQRTLRRLRDQSTAGRLEAQQLQVYVQAEVPRQLILLREMLKADSMARHVLNGHMLQVEAARTAAGQAFFTHQMQPDIGRGGNVIQ